MRGFQEKQKLPGGLVVVFFCWWPRLEGTKRIAMPSVSPWDCEHLCCGLCLSWVYCPQFSAQCPAGSGLPVRRYSCGFENHCTNEHYMAARSVLFNLIKFCFFCCWGFWIYEQWTFIMELDIWILIFSWFHIELWLSKRWYQSLFYIGSALRDII